MPIIDGEEYLTITAAQLDELFFNINFGSVNYRALQPTPSLLFSSQTVAASSSVNSSGVSTGNSAKMQGTFSLAGASTSCTCNIYSTTHTDLSNAGIIATMTIGTGDNPVPFAIEPSWIPAITFAELINNDPTNSAIVTVEIITWKEPESI